MIVDRMSNVCPYKQLRRQHGQTDGQTPAADDVVGAHSRVCKLVLLSVRSLLVRSVRPHAPAACPPSSNFLESPNARRKCFAHTYTLIHKSLTNPRCPRTVLLEIVVRPA